MVKEKTRYVGVRNRMVLFNSRLNHLRGFTENSEHLGFKMGCENRRICLTWLFGDFIDKSTGEHLQLLDQRCEI